MPVIYSVRELFWQSSIEHVCMFLITTFIDEVRKNLRDCWSAFDKHIQTGVGPSDFGEELESGAAHNETFIGSKKATKICGIGDEAAETGVDVPGLLDSVVGHDG